jgi:hypothetical protein
MQAINPNDMAIKAVGTTWQWNPSITGQKCAPLLLFDLRNEGEGKAIPALPSASSARMHPSEYIFVDEAIEDVYLRLISRYEEAWPVTRVVVPLEPCGPCRPYLYQMSLEPPNSRGIFIAWDGVKTLTQVCGLFDVSCAPVLRRVGSSPVDDGSATRFN